MSKMKEPSKLKLKNRDVDKTAENVLADDEEVSDEVSTNEQITNMEPVEALTTASAITVDEVLPCSLENTSLRRTERNEDQKLSDLKLDSDKRKRSDKDVQKYPTSEVVDTNEYLIITLSASRRRELPKIKKSSRSLVPEGSEINTPSSKAKSSGVDFCKTSSVKMSKSTSFIDSKQTSESSNEVIEESSVLKSSKTSSKYSKMSDESNNCESTDTSLSIEASTTYKAKTPFVLHEASEATTKYPDAEFYDEFRNHTTPTKWNNPVAYNNRYPIYFDPYRHFPYKYQPPKCNFRKRTSVKIPKKFSTFLLRVLKSKLVHKETKGLKQKPERSPDKTQEPRYQSTDELVNTIKISKSSEKIEKNLCEQSPAIINAAKELSKITSSTDRIDPTSSTESFGKLIAKPSTLKYRHRYTTSASATDSLSTSTKIEKHIDPLAPEASKNPCLSHSTSGTEAEHLDPLSMNPIKFREKLRKLSNSKSPVESTGAQRKETSSKYKTRATQKTRAEPTTKEENSSATSKAGSISNAELVKNKEKIIRTVIEIGSLAKGDLKCEQEKLREHRHGVKEVTKSGGISKFGVVPKIEEIPTKRTILKVEPKGGAAKGEAISKTEKFATRTVSVFPQDESKSKTSSKTRSVTNLRKGQYRDIPVIAYARTIKNHPPKTNLDYYLPKQEGGWIRSYWRKFKYFKRIESERQQNLLEKIVSSLNQIDLSLNSAYNYSNSIEKLRKVTCDMEESLKYRNENMKWLMSRLMHKTEIISDLLEVIRCDVVLYTLETSASNDITSKRLYKLLKYLCGKQERKRKSEGKLTPVEEEDLKAKT